MNKGETPAELRIRANKLLAKATLLEKRTPVRRVKLRSAKIKKSEEELRDIQRAFPNVVLFTKVHLRIKGKLDVWPTTGRFYNRVTHAKGMYAGIADLIEQIERAERYDDRFRR